jgi:hypothetical protein
LSGNDVGSRHASDQTPKKRNLLEIKRWPGLTPEEDRVAEDVAYALEQDLESYLQRYNELSGTDSGRIVSADNAKELFSQYSASRETRTQFTYAVHPASAVLAGEVFRRKIGEPRSPEERVVYLVTGPPGAGKTMAHGRDVEKRVKVVFEGNITNLRTTFERINAILAVGLLPLIVIVYAEPLVCLYRVVRRAIKDGRVVDIEYIADFLANLASTIRAILQEYGDAVQIEMYDNSQDGKEPQQEFIVEEFLELLEQPNKEAVLKELKKELDRLHELQQIPEHIYEQIGRSQRTRTSKGPQEIT